MEKMTYRQQLLHPNWQRKRLEMLSSAEYRCCNCGDGQTTLHVHHKHYVKGRMADAVLKLDKAKFQQAMAVVRASGGQDL